MKEVIAVLGGMIGIMLTFWILTQRHLTKCIKEAVSNHKQEEKAHLNYIKYADCQLQNSKVIEKLEQMNEELIKLKEELHVFKEKITVKFNL